ncbi:MAG TPA: hypothetical protein VLL97_15215 [Acidobacteriota bacterium]|nr:hypothetical protein [Acidobacteriota bacterium]
MEIRNELQRITGQFRNEAEFEEELARQGIVREALVRNIVLSIYACSVAKSAKRLSRLDCWRKNSWMKSGRNWRNF